jgi:Contact-dependent growth inhibition CdiA C-terminal domain
MANQINVRIQRQSYEPFEAADSEAENSGAEASLADDSAGANTGGNPTVVPSQIDGESVHPAPSETVATNNIMNRYGISDGIIIQRPEYTFNNRAAPVENAVVPNEISDVTPYSAPEESVNNSLTSSPPSPTVTSAQTPTGFVPTPTPQPKPIQICPNQTDLPSSGLETAPPINAKPIAKATTLVFSPRVAIAEASGWNAVPPAPRGCAEYETARVFGAAHGYSDIKIDKLTALLYYQNPEPQFQYDYLGQPNLLSERLDLTPVNADGTFDIRTGFLLIAERLRTPGSEDNSAANDNLRDLAGLGSPLLEGRSPVRGIPRAGAGQGSEDYANEMTMAAPDYGYSYDYDDTTNTYDSPDSTYDDPDSTPQIDLDPLPSLPPVDSNGPVMLPPPDIRLDRELAPIPNINVAEQQSNPLVPEQGSRQPSIEIGEIRLAPPVSTRPEDDRNFIGYNANGTPLIADRPLGTHAEGEIRPTLYRLPGYASAVQNSILGYDDAGTPYSGVRDANGNLSWYRLSPEETRLIPSRDYLQARDFVNGAYGAARELPRNLLNAGAMIVDGYALMGTGAINTVLGTDMQYPPLSSITGNMTFDDLGYAIVANSPVGIVAQAGTGNYHGAGESAVNLVGGIAVGEGVAYAMRGAGRVAGQVREFENTIPGNFETFPMPDGPSPNVFEGIAHAQREAGLRPYVSEVAVDETTKPGTVAGPQAHPLPQDDATTTRSLIRENETADQLAEAGYDVERKPEVPGLKEPDYLVNGDVFDCYAPEPNTSVRNIWDRVKEKIDQAQTERVVVNLADSSRSLRDVIGQFSDFPIPGLKELFIFDQNGNLTILNWTKGK